MYIDLNWLFKLINGIKKNILVEIKWFWWGNSLYKRVLWKK
jgi:hypothetical protein